MKQEVRAERFTIPTKATSAVELWEDFKRYAFERGYTQKVVGTYAFTKPGKIHEELEMVKTIPGESITIVLRTEKLSTVSEMEKGLSKWMGRFGEPITTELYHRVCQSLFINESHKEACWILLHDFDDGKIEEKDLLQGLISVSNKNLEEVASVLGFRPSVPS